MPLRVIAEAVAGGVDVVHLREPHAPARDLLIHGRRIAEVAGDADLVVNDRLDVALALGVAGVQLATHSLPVPEARRVAPELALGASVHSVAEASAAAGADWLLLGTIYPSRSHPGRPGAGPELIAQVRAASAIPIVAIGGISLERVAEVVRAGAHGVAVISAIVGASDPRAAAAAIRERMEAS